MNARQNIDPRRGHRTEHHHGRAAQYRFRYGLDGPGHAWEQAQQDQHAGNPYTDMAAGNPGELNHAVVLRKDRAWKRVKHTGQQRVGTVDQHAALDALHPHRAFNRLARHFTGGGHVANRFQRRHQVNHQHRDKQRPREPQAKVQRHRHLEHFGLMHAGEVQTAQITRQRVAHRQGDDDGTTAHPHQRDTVEDHDNRQHHAGQHQIFTVGEGAIGHGAKTAAHADQADFNQRQANHQHHDTGDQRGDHAFNKRQDPRDAHFYERSGNHHTENRGHHALDRGALLDHQRATGNQRADKVEAGALNNQQTGAKRSEAFALHKGRDARDH